MKRTIAAALLSSFIACAGAQSAASGPVAPASAAAAEPAGASLVGQSLAAAEKTDLFQFFHFAKSGDRPDPAHAGMRLVTYGTTGPFKGRVALLASTKAGDDTIHVTGLMLRRDFIDDATTGTFARDAVKSFLERAPMAAAPEVAALRADLWRPCAARPASSASAASMPAVSKDCADAANTPAWQAFAGKEPKWKAADHGSYVMLQNATLGGAAWLFVEMGAE